MKFRPHPIQPVIYLSVVFFIIGCNNSEEPAVYNPALIFPNSVEIAVAPYVYTDSTNNVNYQVSGDTVVDTLGPQPEFRWERVPSNISTVALFNAPIVVVNNEIQNLENIVWQWHSSMVLDELILDNKTVNRIKYTNGYPVLNKKIQYDTQPLPLQSGLYFWAVWSWDRGGRWVLFSTKPFTFRVE